MRNDTHGEGIRRKAFLSYGLLLLTSILWGSGFVPQKIGADNLSPFIFNGIRYTTAGIAIFCIARFRLPADKAGRRVTILSGCILFAAATMQQIGMKYTTIGNASFITTIYVALVPFLSFLYFRKRIQRNSYIAAFLAICGLYLLSTSGKSLDQMSIGDVIVFLGSGIWATHIITVGKAAEKTDPIQFSSGQFLVCGALNLIFWGFFDPTETGDVLNYWPVILYSGIIVIAGGFTLQAIAQRNAEESRAAIILGLEAVFGAFSGVIILHESFSGIQIVGAVLILISVVVAVREDGESPETVPVSAVQTLNEAGE